MGFDELGEHGMVTGEISKLGNKLEFIIHEPMAVKDYSFEEIIQKTESAVVSAIKI